jgi:hypothetical protein
LALSRIALKFILLPQYLQGNMRSGSSGELRLLLFAGSGIDDGWQTQCDAQSSNCAFHLNSMNYFFVFFIFVL